MRVEPRSPGWLTERFHLQFRELLTHTATREKLFCPAYCLMPDHLHLLWLGLTLASDQLNATKFLRLHLNRILAGESLAPGVVKVEPRPWTLQEQAFDNVLREEDRKRGAFASLCFYILANPVRAGLVTKERDWPFLGALLPGYPDVHPMNDGFWELFWKLYTQQRELPPTEPPRT